jgi:hypothetical protein
MNGTAKQTQANEQTNKRIKRIEQTNEQTNERMNG